MRSKRKVLKPQREPGVAVLRKRAQIQEKKKIGLAAVKEKDPEKFHEIQQKGVEASKRARSRSPDRRSEQERRGRSRSSSPQKRSSDTGEKKIGLAAVKEKDPEKFHEIQQKGVEASKRARSKSPQKRGRSRSRSPNRGSTHTTGEKKKSV